MNGDFHQLRIVCGLPTKKQGFFAAAVVCRSDGKGQDMKKKLLLLSLLWGGVTLSAQTIVQQFTSLSQGAKDSFMELKEPTSKGNVLVAMSTIISPGVRVLSVIDDAPGGSNLYKKIEGASSSCANKFNDIWYCENCKAGATVVIFRQSEGSASVISFLELSNMESTSVLDGSGAHVSDGTATSAGLDVGPSIKTSATDFIVANYFPPPSGVTPTAWTFSPSFAYVKNAPAGTYQPTLTAKAAGGFCIGMAAFKTAAPAAALGPNK